MMTTKMKMTIDKTTTMIQFLLCQLLMAPWQGYHVLLVKSCGNNRELAVAAVQQHHPMTTQTITNHHHTLPRRQFLSIHGINSYLRWCPPPPKPHHLLLVYRGGIIISLNGMPYHLLMAQFT